MRSSADIETPVMTRFPSLPFACAALLVAATAAAAPAPKATYTAALSKAVAARAALDTDAASVGPAALRAARAAVRAFEAVVRRFPTSGYCDDALWEGAQLASKTWHRSREVRDRSTVERLLEFLRREYPTSRYVARVPDALNRLQPPPLAKAPAERPVERPAPPPGGRPAAPPPTRPPPVVASAAAPVAPPPVRFAPASPDTEVPDDYVAPRAGAGATTSAVTAPASPTFARLKRIRRDVLPAGVRLTLELDTEVPYRDQQTATPPRVVLDLRRTRPENPLPGAGIPTATSVVRQVQVERATGDTSRVLIDTAVDARYSLFVLYNPFRLVVDVESGRPGGPPPEMAERRPAAAATAVVPPPSVVAPVPLASRASLPDPGLAPAAAVPGRTAAPLRASDAADRDTRNGRDTRGGRALALPNDDATAPSTPGAVKPSAPASNLRGGFSLSRQLGLRASRIVIDPGHGGHDPGAQVKSLNEADLVLEVALKLERLLKKEPGVEVVMTRRTDVFVPLEERTALANRAGADLFLSIHANASRNPAARGIETYFLNFAPNPEAEAVAARENAASGRAMHHLPDLVRTIALNNKIDESRDFAALVQQALVGKVKGARDLGVKQAPFVVLIGATMPSILAEISFITNRSDAAQLKTGGQRQKIAEALFAGIMRYQRTLKTTATVASQ